MLIDWEGIDTMLAEESYRWDCADYFGVIVIHPSLVHDTLRRIEALYPTQVERTHFEDSTIKLRYGGEVRVRSFVRDSCITEHTGCQYTTVMMTKGANLYGEWEDDDAELFYLRGTDIQHSTDYLKTRLRSASKYPCKFIQM
jgi:hypothetical protein